ncbi:MAG: NAD(P)/FAD-dependent oxidoreductase [Sandaracinaceae bacterium]
MTDFDACDVAICGGGMAGLTMALQLRARLPEASIRVFEPKRRPLPEACFKVGESTVEVGGRYLGVILGLHDYLMEAHLPKNGLRFFSGERGAPLAERAEMGPPEPPTVPAYQIDRGRAENDLRQMCVDRGIDLREGWAVRDVALSGEGHTLTVIETRTGRAPETVRATWFVDASGRRRMIAKQLGLSRPITPQASAAWFRVPERVDIAELVGEESKRWHERDVDGTRWLSTNHLCGRGYWVWVIPLSNGHTSIGVVAENAAHRFNTFSNPSRMMAWLRAHEPHLASRLDAAEPADFGTRPDYRYDTERVLSAERWACLGEAGLFVDPLYSPGADVIAVGNCIAAEAIVDDLGGGTLNAPRIEELNGFLLSWGRMLARTLPGGSMVFGSPEVLGAKLYWDYFYYWALLCPYFFQDLYRLPVEEHRRFSAMLLRWRTLNDRAQSIFAAWSEVSSEVAEEGFVGLPWPATTLSDLHLDLHNDKTPDETYAAMEQALSWGEEIVTEMYLRAARRAGDGATAIAEAVSPPEVPESRLQADEAVPRKRRKLLTRPVRDLERSIGRSVAPEGGPKLREILTRLQA